MNKIFLAAAPVAALLSLAACNNEPEVVDTSPDPQAEALANAAPVELPPAIQASRTYRCKDNSLLYATFYTNDTVKVSSEAGVSAAGTLLTAEGGNPPYTAEGYSLSANADQVSYTAPDSGTQTCNA